MPARWVLRCLTSTLRASKSRTSNSVQSSGVNVTRRTFSTRSRFSAAITPLRKELKDATKASRSKERDSKSVKHRKDAFNLQEWELTVGIEIHAQLNTDHKLFSSAFTDNVDEPNTALEPFDIAIPGSQPTFQLPVLIPALRAALALNCTVSPVSRFDRKHYFYHDQPAGYQITQYYEPFAKEGYVTITASDGLPPQDGHKLEVGIKQIQLEQDTARTQEQDDTINLIDFNRAGVPLIEIISLPHLHSPEAAAAYMRKVQAILYSVDAVTTGMEQGGLRADVNVSVRHRDDHTANHSYGGVSGLGQRTEIKNLSSFKAVEDAIRAERDRQIAVLISGAQIAGETRGWSLSNPGETTRLRGKEGEVDYRYMPDPDVPPLYIDHELVQHFKQTLPPVPEELVSILERDYGLTNIDAKAMILLDDGQRLIYFQDVVDYLPATDNEALQQQWAKTAGNWVLHELGALLSTTDTIWTQDLVPAQSMARIVEMQMTNKITGTSAKKLLRIVFDGDSLPVEDIAQRENLLFHPMDDYEYESLAARVVDENPEVVVEIKQKHKHGKVKFLLGQMMRTGDRNRMEAAKAEVFLQRQLGM